MQNALAKSQLTLYQLFNSAVKHHLPFTDYGLGQSKCTVLTWCRFHKILLRKTSSFHTTPPQPIPASPHTLFSSMDLLQICLNDVQYVVILAGILRGKEKKYHQVISHKSLLFPSIYELLFHRHPLQMS